MNKWAPILTIVGFVLVLALLTWDPISAFRGGFSQGFNYGYTKAMKKYQTTCENGPHSKEGLRGLNQ